MPDNHSDCRCTIPWDRVPVAGARYTTFVKTGTLKFTGQETWGPEND